MRIQIYNKEEAANSRIFLGAAMAAVFLFGAYESWSAWSQYAFFGFFGFPVSWGSAVAGVFVLAGTFATFVVINTPKVVDFCSTVESELRKVSWPTGKQVMNATIVVLAGIVLVTVVLIGWDFCLSTALSYLGIYPRGGSVGSR